jgi:hypothetical protein
MRNPALHHRSSAFEIEERMWKMKGPPEPSALRTALKSVQQILL